MPYRILLASLLATAASAQIQATYDPFGAGCPGTGIGMGPSSVVPQAFANAYAGSNNVMGFQGAPSRYQQVFLGSEFPTARILDGVGLRWDNQNMVQMAGATVDLEIRVGLSTRTPTTLSTTFAANFDLGAPVTVFPRGMVRFPSQDFPPATNPTEFQVLIPWSTGFAWTPQPGVNLVIEFWNRGNNNGPGWNYVFDCGYSASTARLYGSDTATVGATDGFAYGYMMRFMEQTNAAVPMLTVNDVPQFGNQLRVSLSQATPSTFALLVLGLSGTRSGTANLPLDLGPLGAPGCALRASTDVYSLVLVSAAGRAQSLLDIPNSFYLAGLPFYQQFAVHDPAANALGYVMSNGGRGVIGN